MKQTVCQAAQGPIIVDFDRNLSSSILFEASKIKYPELVLLKENKGEDSNLDVLEEEFLLTCSRQHSKADFVETGTDKTSCEASKFKSSELTLLKEGKAVLVEPDVA